MQEAHRRVFRSPLLLIRREGDGGGGGPAAAPAGGLPMNPLSQDEHAAEEEDTVGETRGMNSAATAAALPAVTSTRTPLSVSLATTTTTTTTTTSTQTFLAEAGLRDGDGVLADVMRELPDTERILITETLTWLRVTQRCITYLANQRNVSVADALAVLHIDPERVCFDPSEGSFADV